MCVIIDANVGGNLVNSKKLNKAARKFRDYVEDSKIILVVGGKVKEELYKNSNLKGWLETQLENGAVKNIPNDVVDKIEKEERQLYEENCSSNDKHVLALARASGARLLYTHDQKLAKDFKNKNLINNPRGSVFQTNPTGNLNDKIKQLDNAKCRF